MTAILALDTSGEACSVALSVGDQQWQSYELAAQSHTQRALPMIDEVLEQAQISLKDLDALAIAAGPGSFTGLRIGMGVIQGLAFAADLPVIAVSTLEALAWQQLNQTPEVEWLLPALDARMGETYWAVYRVVQGEISEYKAPAASSPEDVVRWLEEQQITVVGVGAGWSLVSLANSGHEAQPDANLRATSVLALAEQHWLTGEAIDVLEVQPMYIRDKVSWKKRERIRSS